MYELVIIWDDCTKEVHIFKTRADAEEGQRNIEMAFGSQVWCCVREKRA